MNKIKLVKQSYTDINDNEFYCIEGTENYCNVVKDLDTYMAVMYELGDAVAHQVWSDTPRKAANKLLANFDLKIGMEA